MMFGLLDLKIGKIISLIFLTYCMHSTFALNAELWESCQAAMGVLNGRPELDTSDFSDNFQRVLAKSSPHDLVVSLHNLITRSHGERGQRMTIALLARLEQMTKEASTREEVNKHIKDFLEHDKIVNDQSQRVKLVRKLAEKWNRSAALPPAYLSLREVAEVMKKNPYRSERKMSEVTARMLAEYEENPIAFEKTLSDMVEILVSSKPARYTFTARLLANLLQGHGSHSELLMMCHDVLVEHYQIEVMILLERHYTKEQPNEAMRKIFARTIKSTERALIYQNITGEAKFVPSSSQATRSDIIGAAVGSHVRNPGNREKQQSLVKLAIDGNFGIAIRESVTQMSNAGRLDMLFDLWKVYAENPKTDQKAMDMLDIIIDHPRGIEIMLKCLAPGGESRYGVLLLTRAFHRGQHRLIGRFLARYPNGENASNLRRLLALLTLEKANDNPYQMLVHAQLASLQFHLSSRILQTVLHRKDGTFLVRNMLFHDQSITSNSNLARYFSLLMAERGLSEMLAEMERITDMEPMISSEFNMGLNRIRAFQHQNSNEAKIAARAVMLRELDETIQTSEISPLITFLFELEREAETETYTQTIHATFKEIMRQEKYSLLTEVVHTLLASSKRKQVLQVLGSNKAGLRLTDTMFKNSSNGPELIEFIKQIETAAPETHFLEKVTQRLIKDGKTGVVHYLLSSLGEVNVSDNKVNLRHIVIREAIKLGTKGLATLRSVSEKDFQERGTLDIPKDISAVALYDGKPEVLSYLGNLLAPQNGVRRYFHSREGVDPRLSMKEILAELNKPHTTTTVTTNTPAIAPNRGNKPAQPPKSPSPKSDSPDLKQINALARAGHVDLLAAKFRTLRNSPESVELMRRALMTIADQYPQQCSSVIAQLWKTLASEDRSTFAIAIGRYKKGHSILITHLGSDAHFMSEIAEILRISEDRDPHTRMYQSMVNMLAGRGHYHILGDLLIALTKWEKRGFTERVFMIAMRNPKTASPIFEGLVRHFGEQSPNPVLLEQTLTFLAEQTPVEVQSRVLTGFGASHPLATILSKRLAVNNEETKTPEVIPIPENKSLKLFLDKPIARASSPDSTRAQRGEAVRGLKAFLAEDIAEKDIHSVIKVFLAINQSQKGDMTLSQLSHPTYELKIGNVEVGRKAGYNIHDIVGELINEYPEHANSLTEVSLGSRYRTETQLEVLKESIDGAYRKHTRTTNGESSAEIGILLAQASRNIDRAIKSLEKTSPGKRIIRESLSNRFTRGKITKGVSQFGGKIKDNIIWLTSAAVAATLIAAIWNALTGNNTEEAKEKAKLWDGLPDSQKKTLLQEGNKN